MADPLTRAVHSQTGQDTLCPFCLMAQAVDCDVDSDLSDSLFCSQTVLCAVMVPIINFADSSLAASIMAIATAVSSGPRKTLRLSPNEASNTEQAL